MALNVKNTKRKFIIEVNKKKVELIDPHPNMSIQEVINHHVSKYPQLATATVDGPKMEKDAAVYEFKTTIGTKG